MSLLLSLTCAILGPLGRLEGAPHADAELVCCLCSTRSRWSAACAGGSALGPDMPEASMSPRPSAATATHAAARGAARAQRAWPPPANGADRGEAHRNGLGTNTSCMLASCGGGCRSSAASARVAAVRIVRVRANEGPNGQPTLTKWFIRAQGPTCEDSSLSPGECFKFVSGDNPAFERWRWA